MDVAVASLGIGYPKTVGRYHVDAGRSAMAWLLKDGEVLASCDDIFAAPLSRIPVGSPVGAQLIQARRLHFAGSKGADVALLDPDRVVRDLGSFGPWRPIVAKHSGAMIVVADRGAFVRWGLVPGDHLEFR